MPYGQPASGTVTALGDWAPSPRKVHSTVAGSALPAWHGWSEDHLKREMDIGGRRLGNAGGLGLGRCRGLRKSLKGYQEGRDA